MNPGVKLTYENKVKEGSKAYLRDKLESLS
jgi:hypothetical protein